MTLFGLKINPDINISDYRTVKRTWKERLFTRPWRPHISRKSVYDPLIYKVEDALYCSYESFAKIKQHCEEMAKFKESPARTPGQ